MRKLRAASVVATAVVLLSTGFAVAEPVIIHKCGPNRTRVAKSVAAVETAEQIAPPTTDALSEPISVSQVKKDKGLFFVADKTVAHDGECVKLLGVVINSGGRVYVFNIDGQGNAVCLYPNKFVPKGVELKLKDGDKVAIPAPDADFCLKVQAPFGKERIYAILTDEPIDPMSVNAKSFENASVTKVNAEMLTKSLLPTLVEKKADITYIEIETLPNP